MAVYKRERAALAPHAERRERTPFCMVPDCGRKHEARGYCKTHYDRWRKTGDPQAHIPITTPPPNSPLAGFLADVPLTEAHTLYGSVLTCKRCRVNLGPVWTVEQAVLITAAHRERGHV
jgi:hypothetical protein